VTFEIDNSSVGGDWPVSSAAIEALIDVIIFHASISPRANQGFAKNIKTQVQREFYIAWHQQYSATACPGPFVMSQLDYIVAECNKRATQAVAPVAPVIPTPPPASKKPRLVRWLRRGSTGSNVVYLQSVLGLKRDGQFGPITEARVRQFQREQGIKVDGIVGWITWGRLP
jgi:hypothetical protein